MQNAVKKTGFTLMELLVVIAVLGALLVMLLPALSRTRKQATAVACLANQRSFIQAWRMYAGDHNETMVVGCTYPESWWGQTQPDGQAAWCKEPGEFNENGKWSYTGRDDVTDEHRFNGIKAGALYTYLGSVDVYHCPSDNRFTAGTPPFNPYRSYSIQGSMYGEDAKTGHQTHVRAWKKITQITSPSRRYVFLEEATASQWLNAGSWMLGIRHPVEYSEWADNLAGWHNNAGTLNYADGHAELKHWSEERTLEFIADETILGSSVFPHTQIDNKDLQFLIRGYGGFKGQHVWPDDVTLMTQN